jgi:hypothetical protein
MEYELEMLVPANTPQSEPVEYELVLDKGIIEDAYIYFPLGCVHKVLVKVFHGEFQIAPFNRDEWLRGEGAKVPFAAKYPMTDGPFTLTFLCASPNTTYDHKPVAHVTLTEKYVAMPETVLSGQLKKLTETTEKIIAAVTEMGDKIISIFKPAE